MNAFLKDRINLESFTLGGTIICRFQIPQDMVDEINADYDKASGLDEWNVNLAGKIEKEFNVTEILSDDVKNVFRMSFQTYLKTIQKQWWHIDLENAWINDMKAGEYNPFHYHMSRFSDMGLSSVLMLKRPRTYGKEYSREETPANGMLEFNGGQLNPYSISQNRVDAKVGELYVFPYTLLHGVYPFNGTDEIRRTMSFNCNLYKLDVVQKTKENDNA